MRKETEELIEKFGKLYKEGKTKKEIADLTHYSLNTVKQYLSIGGFLDKKRAFNKPQNDTVVKREEPPKKKIEKSVIEKSKEEKKAEPIKEAKPKRKQKEKKPYEILYDNIVIYKGQLYEKLSREDILDLMLNDMMIKKARKKKK